MEVEDATRLRLQHIEQQKTNRQILPSVLTPAQLRGNSLLLPFSFGNTNYHIFPTPLNFPPDYPTRSVSRYLQAEATAAPFCPAPLYRNQDLLQGTIFSLTFTVRITV